MSWPVDIVHARSEDRSVRGLCVLCFLSWPLSATAQDVEPAPASDQTARQSAEAGMFLPFTLAPRVDSQTAFVVVGSGYDSARGATRVQGTAEMTLWGPVALRVGAVAESHADIQPTFGLRVQALRQGRHGLDASVGATYNPISYEGHQEIEATVAIGRRFGAVSVFSNFIYGQELEDDQRHGEVRVAALHHTRSNLQLGVDSRLRVDLDAGRSDATRDVDFDLMAGPVGLFRLGRIALLSQTGVSAVRFKNEPTQAGLSVLAGVGTAF